MDSRIYAVGDINSYIKSMFDGDKTLAAIYIRGELSNYKAYPSGHHYFSMKDADGTLKCVMFKSSALKLRFKPDNGMKVVAFGRISVYPRDGAYQLYVEALTADGVGDLYAEYERLKAKLGEEGLFDDEHKKPLPDYPGEIALITSSAGAAVRDMIRVLGARWPLARVKILPVRVQGVEAPPEIVGAIRYANRHRVADLIITGRGGGSIEDLWAFNDERVARAIYDSDIPIISAVGHEPDVTIADFVADCRAATPSNAAELAVPDVAQERDALLSLYIRIGQTITGRTKALRERLKDLSGRRVMISPKYYLDDRRLSLDRAGDRLASAMRAAISTDRERYASGAASLDALSPLKVLGRGYAIARRADGTVIRSAKDVTAGERIFVRVKKDELDCTVNQPPKIGGKHYGKIKKAEL